MGSRLLSVALSLCLVCLSACAVEPGIMRQSADEIAPGERAPAPKLSPRVSDDVLRTEIFAAVANDPAIDEFQFHFRVSDGRVWITGRGSEGQKERVSETVSRVGGVRGVENDVVVSVAGSARLDTPAAVPPSDEEIERAIEDAIERDADADFTRIMIQCQEGQVVLRGAVPNLRTKYAMGEAAARVSGVSRVFNRLEVRVWRTRSDNRLLRDVRAALAFEPLLGADDFTVSARHGVVALGGEVSSPWKRALATRLVAGVWGVTAIENHLRVARFPGN